MRRVILYAVQCPTQQYYAPSYYPQNAVESILNIVPSRLDVSIHMSLYRWCKALRDLRTPNDARGALHRRDSGCAEHPERHVFQTWAYNQRHFDQMQPIISFLDSFVSII